MAITLQDDTTSAVLTLPADLYWVDEFDWTPVIANSQRSLTGVLIIQQALKTGGRPVTLSASTESNWLKRSMVVTLAQWATLPQRVFTLTIPHPLGLFSLKVVFNHAETPVEAKPVIDQPVMGEDTYYNSTLRFLEVTP